MTEMTESFILEHGSAYSHRMYGGYGRSSLPLNYSPIALYVELFPKFRLKSHMLAIDTLQVTNLHGQLYRRLVLFLSL